MSLSTVMLAAAPAFATLHGFGVRSNTIGWIANRVNFNRTVVLTGGIVCDKGETFSVRIVVAQPPTNPTVVGVGTTTGTCIDKKTVVAWKVNATRTSTTAFFKKSPPLASGTARVRTLLNGTQTSSLTRTHTVDIVT